MHAQQRVAVLIGATAFLAASSVAAPGRAAGPVFIANDQAAAAAASDYWTPERMKNAKPLDLPGVAGRGGLVSPSFAAGPGSASSPPRPPVGSGDSTVKLHDPVPVPSAEDGVGPKAVNPSGQRFTHSRVVPMSVLRGTYPWQTVGKLFFTTPTGDATCSGAVNQRRVIATAGHCVYDPVRRQFFTNFFFVPGFDNGLSPCGGYDWSFAVTTGSWANGGGRFPNAADFAILVAVNKACRGQTRIGLSLGWLGWRTLSLLNNHVTILGYPLNLDQARILQQTNAQVTRASAPNSAEAGTFQEGGASGGPWVQDWGVTAGGQPANTLQIVGITSYQPRNRSLDYLGSSILNNEWVTIFNIACGQVGACS